jgi:hypothetical protein
MKKFVTLILLLSITQVYSQSPWTQKKGKAYTQVSYTTIANYSALYGNPDIALNGSISDNTIQLYAEYGLSDKTSLLINLPFKSISHKNISIACVTTPCGTISNEDSGFGNIEIAIKRQLYKKDWILSAQLGVEANTGSFDAASGIRTGYDAWSFTPLFLAGRSFGNTYVQGFLGASVRTGNYSSNFKIGGEVGTKAFKNIWLIGFVDISSSFKNGDVVLPTSNQLTGLYVNDQEYGAMGAKIIAEISKSFGVNAGFGGAFSGNNVAKRAALTFGVYHKF